MGLLLVKWDDPILHKVCEPVRKGEGLTFVPYMRKLVSNKAAAGIAAPQVGIAKRVIVVAVNIGRPGLPLTYRVMLNPEIIEFSPEKKVAHEGCLSYPGLEVPVERSIKIKVRYQTMEWRQIEETYENFNARIVQHEVDHLNGITIDDHSKEKAANGHVQPPSAAHPRVNAAIASAAIAAGSVALSQIEKARDERP